MFTKQTFSMKTNVHPIHFFILYTNVLTIWRNDLKEAAIWRAAISCNKENGTALTYDMQQTHMTFGIYEFDIRHYFENYYCHLITQQADQKESALGKRRSSLP